LIIQGFQKEYKLKLSQLLGIEPKKTLSAIRNSSKYNRNSNGDIQNISEMKDYINTRNHILDFSQVSMMMLEMGFLTQSISLA
jgi:hypothetical protein